MKFEAKQNNNFLEIIIVSSEGKTEEVISDINHILWEIWESYPDRRNRISTAPYTFGENGVTYRFSKELWDLGIFNKVRSYLEENSVS